MLKRSNKLLKKLLNFLKALQSYKEIVAKPNLKKKANSLQLVVQLSNPAIYNRYFYNLLKFFKICNYTIYWPDFKFDDFRKKYYLKNNESWNYFNLIFDEKLICFKQPPKKFETRVILDDTLISSNYFHTLNSTDSNVDCTTIYHVPMSMHPKFYSKDLWSKPVLTKTCRKRTIFFSGNFNSINYNQLDKKIFNMPNRIETRDFLTENKITFGINSKSSLDDFLKNDIDEKVILLDSSKFTIPINELRGYLNQFSFFLALPGTKMPLCHNLVEALSCGCIPIIHEKYASLIFPKLTHMHNAIVYTNFESLTRSIKFAFELNADEIFSISENCNEYYREQMTAQAVVENFQNKHYKKIFLQASYNSVYLLKK